jgi:hypothetical protein
MAQVDCDVTNVGKIQRITYEGTDYDVTLVSVQWQPKHGTYKYRILVESDGLGWHSRSFSDEFDMCGAPDGTFVTLFHSKKAEPLERIAKAFFGRKWDCLCAESFCSLAVSRFLAASIAGQLVEEAFQKVPLTYYPGARLVGGVAPMFASGCDLWVGYRFFSEDAYAWARRSTGNASRVIALYFADTKYQFRTDLPFGAEVISIAQLDATMLAGRYDDLIRVLFRGLQLPTDVLPCEQLARLVLGLDQAPPIPLLEADVHEALAALKRSCTSKAELRYQLAAAVVLNAWIEEERRLGFVRRKKFYAFKQHVGALVRWAADANLPNVRLWAETGSGSNTPILYVRIDDVDFSFHAIPGAEAFVGARKDLTWTGARLKPIAPIVLAWARILRAPEAT